jgi:hypothetical protein
VLVSSAKVGIVRPPRFQPSKGVPMMRRFNRIARALACCGGTALITGSLLASVPAHAAPSLIGTTVNAQVLAPALSADFSNLNIAVTAAVEISAGDGSAIGNGFLLTGVFNGGNLPEQVDFDALTISLRILAGDPGPPLNTGAGAGAKWLFSGLDIAGFDIIGAAITANSGFSNFASNWLSFDDATDIVTLAIDTMAFTAGTGGNSAFGELTITLNTRAITEPPNPPLPEPGSIALACVALLSLWATRRRQTNG